MTGDSDSDKTDSPGPSADEFDGRVLALVAQVDTFGVEEAFLWHTDIADSAISAKPVYLIVEVEHD